MVTSPSAHSASAAPSITQSTAALGSVSDRGDMRPFYLKRGQNGNLGAHYPLDPAGEGKDNGRRGVGGDRQPADARGARHPARVKQDRRHRYGGVFERAVLDRGAEAR